MSITETQGQAAYANAKPTTDLALNINRLSKCYQIYNHPRDRLFQGIWGQRRKLYKEFWALHELSFSLKRGQTLGIVGRNGSGKSTLLQLICGTLTPTTGCVEVFGRIGALLELGSGFNPEFSGRENVLLNAALLGLQRDEIDERLDDILAFADIGDFIDQPVKTYSSGMAIRLAFAVQAHIAPDLLVVDEALAVGDELFQKKCYAHLERLKEQGTSILLVTHSCPQIIQHCDEALLLHRGWARLLGAPAQVTVFYQRLIHANDTEWDRVLPMAAPGYPLNTSSVEEKPWPSQANTEAAESNDKAWLDRQLVPASTTHYPERGACITSVQIETVEGELVNVLPPGQPFRVSLEWQALEALERVSCSCHIASLTGQRITGQRFPEANQFINAIAPRSTWTVSYTFQGGLWPGVYFVGAGLISTKSGERIFLHRITDACALRILDTGKLAVIGGCNLMAQPPKLSAADQVAKADSRRG